MFILGLDSYKHVFDGLYRTATEGMFTMMIKLLKINEVNLIQCGIILSKKYIFVPSRLFFSIADFQIISSNYWMRFCDIQNNQGRGRGYHPNAGGMQEKFMGTPIVLELT